MHKNLPQAMLHNYFYGPLAGSIKIAQLCKIAALPTLEPEPEKNLIQDVCVS